MVGNANIAGEWSVGRVDAWHEAYRLAEVAAESATLDVVDPTDVADPADAVDSNAIADLVAEAVGPIVGDIIEATVSAAVRATLRATASVADR